jgi:hypothetical protein
MICERCSFSVDRAFLQLTVPTSVAVVLATVQLPDIHGADMTRLKDSAVEPASRSETVSPSSVSVLAPGERHAPIADLSPSKRSALVACFNAGGLSKKDGAWHGAPGGKPVYGITTADLARDGMLIVTTNHRNGSARLTERGNWFARTLLSDGTAAKLAARPKRLAHTDAVIEDRG